MTEEQQEQAKKLLKATFDILQKCDDSTTPKRREIVVCPECMEKVEQEELDMFGGLCEICNEPV